MKGFSVTYRNPGHWDIYDNIARLFRIRGEPGNVIVFDERRNGGSDTGDTPIFRTVSTAMLWISDELMREKQP